MHAHTIQPGEHLDGLCARLGADPAEVWHADDNADLRAQRDDPAVLAPGDVIYLPEPAETPVALSLHTTNRYSAQLPMVPVRLRLHQGDEALANEPYEVEGAEPPITGTTDGDGVIGLQLPATTERAVVQLTQRDLQLQVLVGHLDPVSSESGVRARLQNLGYLPTDPRRDLLNEQARRAQLERAIRSFQRDQDLQVTGEIDEQVRAALREEQGA